MFSFGLLVVSDEISGLLSFVGLADRRIKMARSTMITSNPIINVLNDILNFIAIRRTLHPGPVAFPEYLFQRATFSHPVRRKRKRSLYSRKS